jgi:hypothetical protein
MYEWRESFSLLAELSIAVVGFSGIIGAFYANSRISRGSKAYLDIYYLLAYGFQALFGCLVPFIVFDWVMDEAYAWRICNALLLGWGVMTAFKFREENKKLFKQDRGMSILMGTGDILFSLLALANISGLFFEPSGRVYAMILYWVFFGSMVGFTKVISHTWFGVGNADD